MIKNQLKKVRSQRERILTLELYMDLRRVNRFFDKCEQCCLNHLLNVVKKDLQSNVQNI